MPSLDDESGSITQVPMKLSVLESFLLLRSHTTRHQPQRCVVKASNAAKVTAEELSKTYTKSEYDQRTRMQRAALREPEDLFANNVDAYAPQKRQQTLRNLHRDEKDVNDVFMVETRALLYERQILGKPVCDREENRHEYDEKLWRLMVDHFGQQDGESMATTDESK